MKTTSIITTCLARAAMTLLMLLTLAHGAWAKDFITEVMVIGGTQDEVNNLKNTYENQGWTVINKDLNAGCGSKSDYIYLLYKTADNYTTADLTFITGFYISNASGAVPDTYSYNGHTYHLVPYEGGEHFEELQGDLNSNAKGDNIHLYYTKEKLSSNNSNYNAVKSITFNDTQSGAVGVNGGTTGYDLNKGSGSGSDYIYMHPGTDTAHKWTLNKNSNGTTCSITGSSYGSDNSKVKSVPAIIEGAVVTGINSDVDFTQFINLETFYFSNSIAITTMPSLADCTKFSEVKIVDNDCNVLKTNELPSCIKSIPTNAFKNTKITTLTMPGVTSIGTSAFSGCSSLTSITIPGGVTSIGASTFSGCSSLASFTIPSSVTSIGASTFYGCSSLASITIPGYVESIGDAAFSGCSKLTKVSIPANVTSLGESAFSGCTKLATVNISSHAIVSKTYSKSSSLKDIFGIQVKKYTLENGVTSIGDYAFYGCKGVERVNLPTGVTTIGTKAFEGCSDMTYVSIPNSITKIEFDAFKGCTALAEVNISNLAKWCNIFFSNAASNPLSYSHNVYLNGHLQTSIIITDAVTSISDMAFYGCSGLTSITINRSVKSIGSSTFTGCSGLASVIIPSNVESIGSSAFMDCFGLTTVNIPSSVRSIGENAFKGCTGLPVINDIRYADTYLVEAVDKSRSEYQIRNGTRFVGNEAFCECTGMTAIDIPGSVTYIGSYAFFYCSGLTSITIPNSMTSIEEGTFYNCNNLTSVTIPNSVTSIGGFAFLGCSALTSVTIPRRVKRIGNECFLECISVTDVYCYADPSDLNWEEGNCDDFMKNRETKCHVFKNTNWGRFEYEVNVTFVDDLTIRLEDQIDNTNMIKEFYEEEFYDITLVSRTLYKDGGWNTLCLPFNLEDFNGTPLEGATVKTLNSSSIANGTLTLNFSSATSIAAGSPYIVKWDKADDYVDDNDHNLHEPTFCHVRIRQELHPVDQAAIDFIGSYSPVSFAKDDKTKLYIGADNKLYYPGTVTTIGSFRAYFQLANALTDVSTGDVNGDGSISVTDVTFLVDKILGNVNENFVMENADVNGDGYISVTDVTALVNIILGNDSSTFTIVTNLDDIPITFGGGGSGPARVSKNLK